MKTWPSYEANQMLHTKQNDLNMLKCTVIPLETSSWTGYHCNTGITIHNEPSLASTMDWECADPRPEAFWEKQKRSFTVRQDKDWAVCTNSQARWWQRHALGLVFRCSSDGFMQTPHQNQACLIFSSSPEVYMMRNLQWNSELDVHSASETSVSSLWVSSG